MNNRTREEMTQIIDRGESVFVQMPGGALKLVTRHQDIPSDADLARDSADPAKIAAARDVLRARRRAIDAELAALASDPPTAEETTAAPGPDVAPAAPKLAMPPAPVAAVAPKADGKK